MSPLVGNYDRPLRLDRFFSWHPAGVLTLDASSAECHVLTFKEGALSALAHDLELKVSRLTLEIEPAGDAEYQLVARVAADSLVVLHAMKDGRPTDQLSASDRRKIEKTITSDVLDVRRHPEIRYEATATPLATGDGSGDAFALTGELTLQGKRRPLAAVARLHQGRMRAEVTLHQPDFGIQPFRALLGALKLRPEVKVRISLPWPLPLPLRPSP
jgi:polyisoprenoid-binding protein YceI